MKRLTAWLDRKSVELETAPPPVPGWLNGWALTIFGVIAIVKEVPDVAITFFVGSLVVSTMRQIERDRRGQ